MEALDAGVIFAIFCIVTLVFLNALIWFRRKRVDNSLNDISRSMRTAPTFAQRSFNHQEGNNTVTTEATCEYKTCDLYAGSTEPLLSFGAIADLEVFDDNDLRATVVATQKAFDLRFASQDVLVLMGDIDPEHDPRQLQADEIQFSDLNRVRVWSLGVLVFDKNIGDYDVSDFDGTSIMGYLEDGTSIALYLGRDTRVLLEQLD